MTTRAPSTLLDSLRTHATERPDHPAVRNSGVTLSYRELDRRSDELAATLRSRGVAEGDRVAFLGRESVDYYAVLFSAAKLGAVLVPINWRLSTAEVTHILDDSDASVVLTDPDQTQVPADDPRRMLTTRPTDLAAGSEPLEPVPACAETPIVQLYTSGTTGLPKGVVLGHRSFFAIADSLRSAGLRWVSVDPDDVCFVGIPGFHVGGLWFAAQAFNAGATVVSVPLFDPAGARQLIARERVTAAIWVPAMLQALLTAPSATANDFSTVRLTIYGGAPISEVLLERCIRQIGGSFAQIYGLTETGNTAICLPPEDHTVGSPRLSAAGRPYPGVKVKVVNQQGETCPPGEIGEVWLHTPARMIEYWRRPEATATTLVDGWIRTGDAGLLDEDGYLWLKDRLNDMIVVGGENVYPAEVERVLAQHPAVDDVAVVGIPDEVTGESVLAIITTTPGTHVTPRDLTLHARSKLADFKLPRRYEFTNSIPRNPSGKILRRQLREPYWGDRDRRIN